MHQKKVKQQNDIVWKEILFLYLKEFIEFFWSDAYKDIDWTKPYESLEQELLQICSDDAISNRRHVDKLFKVFLNNGAEQWILLHIEIQHKKQSNFPKHMFTYCIRLLNKYDRNVASMAVLADKDPNWRPNQYQQQMWNSTITRTYEVVKILDYQGQEQMLMQTKNPFGLIVLAQLIAIKTSPKEKNRLVSKIALTKLLLKHKWEREKIRSVLIFLDNLLVLDDNLKKQYVEKVEEFKQKEGIQMRLTTSFDDYEFQQGKQEGEIHMLLNLLKIKFSDVSDEYIAKVKTADPITLECFFKNFVFANSIDEVFKE